MYLFYYIFRLKEEYDDIIDDLLFKTYRRLEYFLKKVCKRKVKKIGHEERKMVLELYMKCKRYLEG